MKLILKRIQALTRRVVVNSNIQHHLIGIGALSDNKIKIKKRDALEII